MEHNVELSASDRIKNAARRIPWLSGALKWGKGHLLPGLRRSILNAVRAAIPAALPCGLPKGVYRSPQNFSSPRDGRMILIDQGAPAVPDDSMMVMCGRQQHLQQPWPIFWHRSVNAHLVGPSLAQIDSQRRLRAESVYHPFHHDDPSYNSFVRGKPTHLPGRWTSLVSRWSSLDRLQPYGHWILDALPRLAVLPEFPEDTGILVPPFKTRYQEESLRILGILDRCRWTNETNLRIDEYYFSAPTSMVVSYSPYSVDFLRSAFLPHAVTPRGAPKRVFVTRNTRFRGVANQEDVLGFFAEVGWTVCDTAEMPFAEQVGLFSTAEAICMVHGSAVQNTVWSSAGSHVIELFIDKYLAGDGEWIAQCTQAKYSFLIFPCDGSLSIEIDIDSLRNHLKRLHLLS